MSLLGFCMRLAAAYALLRGVVWACTAMMGAAGFPEWIGEALAGTIIGVSVLRLRWSPLRSLSPWQYALLLSGLVIVVALPLRSVFEAWEWVKWEECAATVCSSVFVGKAVWQEWRLQPSADDNPYQDTEH